MPIGSKHERYALVTGASAGIGRQIAIQLASQNINLILASRNVANLERLKIHIENTHEVMVAIVSCDLSERGAARELYRTCGEMNIPVDMLINNAGQGMWGNAIDQDVDRIEKMLVLNVVSPTVLSTLFAQDMKERGCGHILNIGSLAGNQPTPFFGSYAASKSYLFDFTVALYYEMRRFGVSATCFVAGFVKTDFDMNARIESSRYLAFSQRNGQSPEQAARLALKAMFSRKGIAYAGAKNAALAALSSAVPMRMKAAAILSMMKKLSQ